MCACVSVHVRVYEAVAVVACGKKIPSQKTDVPTLAPAHTPRDRRRDRQRLWAVCSRLDGDFGGDGPSPDDVRVDLLGRRLASAVTTTAAAARPPPSPVWTRATTAWRATPIAA